MKLIFVLKTFQKSFSSHTYQKVLTRINTETQRHRNYILFNSIPLLSKSFECLNIKNCFKVSKNPEQKPTKSFSLSLCLTCRQGVFEAGINRFQIVCRHLKFGF